MTKLELVDAVIRQTKVTGAVARLVEGCLDFYLSHIIDALARGEDVQHKGFGRFQVVTRARRKAYDFKEKQTIDLPPSRRAVFTPYQRLTDAIKENTDV